ncbi:MAG: DUF4396 domain-containing protein [Solirubrobacterales bacterium]
MEAVASSHHAMPTHGRKLDQVTLSATLHCLTGCAIGEVAGMAIGTALGFSNLGTIALAVALAFVFGYSLTSLPLLRAGMALGAVIPVALATDTFSIATMEIVDNLIMLVIPGAMESGVGSVLFWGSLSVALVVAGIVAFPVNRWLIQRGKGHTALHETGIHGGPDTRIVGAVAVVAAIFGSIVLITELASGDAGEGHGAGHEPSAPMPMESDAEHAEEGPGHSEMSAAATPVRGLASSADGMKLELDQTELPRGRPSELSFSIVEESGSAVTDYEFEHEKQMHLIVARRDMTEFQHLHPKLAQDGTWSTPIELDEAGSYRVFADFKRDGVNQTLASDLAVDGEVDWQALPAPTATITTEDGYELTAEEADAVAGEETELTFSVAKNGKPVEVEPYLGANGHLVALREGDLAFLHVHPVEHDEHGGGGEQIAFATEFPTDGRYGLFLQFKADGKVHTAGFTEDVAR